MACPRPPSDASSDSNAFCRRLAWLIPRTLPVFLQDMSRARSGWSRRKSSCWNAPESGLLLATTWRNPHRFSLRMKEEYLPLPKKRGITFPSKFWGFLMVKDLPCGIQPMVSETSSSVQDSTS